MENPLDSDNDLIAAYLEGDKASLEILVSRHFAPVYRLIRRYTHTPEDAEDITQEVFVKAWRHLRSFDHSRQFRPWLFSIARNASLDFIKKKTALPFSALENKAGENTFTETLADSSVLGQESLERQEAGRAAGKALGLLSPKQQKTLALRYGKDLTFRRISEILGEPLHTVKSRNQRALALLKELLAHSPHAAS